MNRHMKTLLNLMGLGCALVASAAETRDDLVAHEWGTFTAVVGSDGVEVPWWSNRVEGPTELPAFVRQMIVPVSKAGMSSWLLRMETPVIYFYAKHPANLTVTVDDSRVRVTEAYPAVLPHLKNTIEPIGAASRQEWRVGIQPPESTVGKQMPVVGERGAHYGRAREVPEAWWVVSQSEPKAVEKFIFYRGAGSVTMPRRVSKVVEQGVELFSSRLPMYVVEVEKGVLRWKRLDQNRGETQDRDSPFLVSWPSHSTDSESGADRLASALTEDLDEAGLTPDEAKAMVQTWREAWLEETGVRVLELLPRQWVDEVLPLKITPMPAETERVFLARWELLKQETEQLVISTLEEDMPDEAQVERLRGLQLGRFLNAALERAAVVRDRKFRALAWMTAFPLNSPVNSGTN